MKIICDTNFLHGRLRLEKGGQYDLPDRLGGYFTGCGWAHEAAEDDAGKFEVVDVAEASSDARPPVESATLEVQGVQTEVQSPEVKHG